MDNIQDKRGSVYTRCHPFQFFRSISVKKTNNRVVLSVKVIADGITGLANKFSQLSPAGQQFALVMGGTAIVIGPALISIGNLITAIGNISKAFGTVSTAIANLGGMSNVLGIIFNPWVIGIGAAIIAGYEIYKHWDTIKQGANDLWIKLTTVFQGIKTSITSA